MEELAAEARLVERALAELSESQIHSLAVYAMRYRPTASQHPDRARRTKAQLVIDVMGLQQAALAVEALAVHRPKNNRRSAR